MPNPFVALVVVFICAIVAHLIWVEVKHHRADRRLRAQARANAAEVSGGRRR